MILNHFFLNTNIFVKQCQILQIYKSFNERTNEYMLFDYDMDDNIGLTFNEEYIIISEGVISDVLKVSKAKREKKRAYKEKFKELQKKAKEEGKKFIGFIDDTDFEEYKKICNDIYIQSDTKLKPGSEVGINRDIKLFNDVIKGNYIQECKIICKKCLVWIKALAKKYHVDYVLEEYSYNEDYNITWDIGFFI